LKTRVAYSKLNEAKYIAHLDLTRVFDRALRRARIQLKYSEGFNPHPKIAFGPPLPVGVEGMEEYVDIDLKVEKEGSPQQDYLRQASGRLQKELPPGIILRRAVILPEGSKALMAIISLAVYRVIVPFTKAVDPLVVAEACWNFMDREEVLVFRVSKGKKIQKNIRPFVKNIQLLTPPAPEMPESAVKFELRLEIKTGNEGSVRPSEIIGSLTFGSGITVDFPGIRTVRESLWVEDKDGGRVSPLEL